MSTPNSLETEVKIRLADLSTAESRLQNAGFRVSVPRLLETNTLFDTPGSDLKRNQKLLRLRRIDSRTVLTWKGPSVPGPHKTRPEFETTVESFDTLARIFNELGYAATFRYEKYRTEYRDPATPDSGVATLDETPIGNFMELEGPSDWIDATAARLGFTPSQYVLASYGRLYLDYCAVHGVTPADMLFVTAS